MTHDRIISLHKQGLSLRAIAKQVGCSHSKVALVLKSVGLSSKAVSPGDPIAIATKAQIVQMYLNGCMAKDIVKKTGCSTRTIYKVLREYDVPGRNEVNVQVIKAVVMMFCDQHSLEEIAAATQLSLSVVKAIAEAAQKTMGDLVKQ